MDNMLAAFKAGIREAKKQQKSDDIIAFMRNNWRLFCSSRSQIEELIDELERQGMLTVGNLADALELPPCVVFKKVKVVDAAKVLLRPKTSAIYKVFKDTLTKMDDGFLCLVVVAGDHTIVMTNMKTQTVPGLVHVYIAAESVDEDDVHIFSAADAPQRLPRIFNHEDDRDD